MLNASMVKHMAFVMVASAVLFVSASFVPVPTAAQENANAQPIFTYVNAWGVPRAEWGDVAKIGAAEKATLDPLVANGTLLGYGFFENRVHSVNGLTHGTWVQASSLANLFKALEMIYAQPEVTAPVLAHATHFDYLMSSNSYKTSAINNGTGYIRVISAQIQPGKMPEFNTVYNRYLVPVLDRLAAEGGILGYQRDQEYNVENAPGRVFLAMVTGDAEGLDKIRIAFDALLNGNPAVAQELNAVAVPNSRNDTLARVTAMTHK